MCVCVGVMLWFFAWFPPWQSASPTVVCLICIYGYIFSPERDIHRCASLVGCVCFSLPSKLLRARPTEPPGTSVQTGLSSASLSNTSEVGGKKHLCVQEREEIHASWTFSSLTGLINFCLVMILGLWLVGYMHANDLFSTDCNNFCTSSVAQQLEVC